MIAIIVAHASNGVIGRDGGLPWELPSDLKRFRKLTTEQAVVMGRRTFESLPDDYRPLPKRRNLVLSSNPDYRADGAEVFTSLEEALDACGRDCWVIGGGATYEQAMPLADRVYATHVQSNTDGDTLFPRLDETVWSCVEESNAIEENGFRFRFKTYERAG